MPSELEAHQIPLPQSPQPAHPELSASTSNAISESLADRLRRLALGASVPTTPTPKRQTATNAAPSEAVDDEDKEPPETFREPLWDPTANPLPTSSTSSDHHAEALYDDPSSDDDGEGEWITPTNVSQHQARAKDSKLVPAKVDPNQTLEVACMTSDFAMQNVLLQMGLNLVSSDGKKIDKVKTWVLRCHACFK